jgi:hypothetical protein
VTVGVPGPSRATPAEDKPLGGEGVDAMTAVKIVTVLGTSTESWDDAAREAVAQASETIRDIHGIEVTDMTADVVDGGVTEFKTTVQVAFPVHHET